ncbi:MAG: hypothetical protein JWO20_2467 [Candidatus Angelobacter sp.]|jgi:hypothetical protein|nr:hypothetical protein [Candidatus Angelobacter sp.]
MYLRGRIFIQVFTKNGTEILNLLYFDPAAYNSLPWSFQSQMP